MTRLVDLPPDCLAAILSHLPGEEILALPAVHTVFADLLHSHNPLWEKLYDAQFGVGLGKVAAAQQQSARSDASRAVPAGAAWHWVTHAHLSPHLSTGRQRFLARVIAAEELRCAFLRRSGGSIASRGSVNGVPRSQGQAGGGGERGWAPWSGWGIGGGAAKGDAGGHARDVSSPRRHDHHPHRRTGRGTNVDPAPAHGAAMHAVRGGTMHAFGGTPSEQAVAAQRSLRGGGSVQIALVGLRSSAHWTLLHAMMWGGSSRSWEISGLHPGVGGFGAGVEFAGVFGEKRVTVRAVALSSMISEASASELDPRAVAFLHGCDAAIGVVGEQRADGAADGIDGDPGIGEDDGHEPMRVALGMLARHLPRRGVQQRDRSSSAARMRPDVRPIPLLLARATEEARMRSCDIRDTVTDTGLAAEASKGTVSEWMAAKVDVRTLAGLNEGLLWLLERVGTHSNVC